MGTLFFFNSIKTKTTLLLVLVAIVALPHFTVPTDSHPYHVIHIILRKLYFLPPVIAAAWFGFRGAALTTLATSVLFTIHAFLDWPGNYMEQANQLGELASFWVVGLIAGLLFDRQRSLMQRLANANEETILALVSSLDLRERNTRLHSQRVRDYTLLLADRYGVTEEERKVIGFGALLHDVGKIAVPDKILLKPSDLSEDERNEMRRHPVEGHKLLRKIDFLRDAAEIVYAHHEHVDGSGYPRGLKGDEIPLGARLFMVADVYDAITSERPYRTPVDHDEAIEVILNERGSHFDVQAVDAFLKIQEEEIQAIAEHYRNREASMIS